ncbi:hypothetical protein KY358_04770 [Candidatus Woesearchaeota archaeon]|nr:hypothetical protein [Candidatus Woesearchaeota archaeon]
MLGIILSFFSGDEGFFGITGFVSSSIYKQDLNMAISESQNFILTSNSAKPFTINSIRLSGEVIGKGQAKVYIDTGTGQNVLIFSNVAEKKENEKGILGITGMAVEDDAIAGYDESKILIIKPLDRLLEKGSFEEIEDYHYLKEGLFKDECAETCFISMDVSSETRYRLVALVEDGTKLKLDEISYQVSED